jgi:hypothetical protein
MAKGAKREYSFVLLTVESAKSLKGHETLYHTVKRNADGTPQRWRISGKIKTWVKTPNRVEFPVKHGLYDNDRVTNDVIDMGLVAVSYTEN